MRPDELEELARDSARAGWRGLDVSDAGRLRFARGRASRPVTDRREITNLVMVADWHLAGAPTVWSTIKRGEMLATDEPAADRQVSAPWRAWLVVLPELPVFRFPHDTLATLLVHCIRDRWSYIAFGREMRMMEYACTPADLLNPPPAELADKLDELTMPARNTLGRIIVNSVQGLRALDGVRIAGERAAFHEEYRSQLPVGDYWLLDSSNPEESDAIDRLIKRSKRRAR